MFTSPLFVSGSHLVVMTHKFQIAKFSINSRNALIWLASVGISTSVLAANLTNSVAPSPTPKLAPAPPDMIWVPGGEFAMGPTAPNEGFCTPATMSAVRDTQPIHRVYVDGFWMDKTEVTNEQFKKFVDATGYITI